LPAIPPLRYNVTGDLLMAKRTNRVTWTLAAVLTVMVLGGSGWLFANYQGRLPPEDRWLALLPRSEWGFATEQTVIIGTGWGRSGWESSVVVSKERRRIGFFAVRVK
jgi:hypothetical protein